MGAHTPRKALGLHSESHWTPSGANGEDERQPRHPGRAPPSGRATPAQSPSDPHGKSGQGHGHARTCAPYRAHAHHAHGQRNGAGPLCPFPRHALSGSARQGLAGAMPTLQPPWAPTPMRSSSAYSPLRSTAIPWKPSCSFSTRRGWMPSTAASLPPPPITRLARLGRTPSKQNHREHRAPRGQLRGHHGCRTRRQA